MNELEQRIELERLASRESTLAFAREGLTLVSLVAASICFAMTDHHDLAFGALGGALSFATPQRLRTAIPAAGVVLGGGAAALSHLLA